MARNLQVGAGYVKYNIAQTRLEQTANGLRRIVDNELPKAIRKAIAAHRSAGNEQVLEDSRKTIAETLRREEPDPPERKFFPQSVPAYAATEAFSYFKEQFPEYSYKEAVLNPTNPRDRTSDWEADIVNKFRQDPAIKEYVGRRDTLMGPALFVGNPHPGR